MPRHRLPLLLAAGLAVAASAPCACADAPAAPADPTPPAAVTAPDAAPAPATAPATATAAPALSAERADAYLAFRRDFDAGRYAEALPHAERVVALTELLDAHHPDLARALNNLGATQYRLSDFAAAAKSYGRAIQLVEESHGELSPRLLGPLRGLALTLAATARPELAVPLLERAVAISRRSQGLFNREQRELLRPLADAYFALGRYRDADRVHQYLFSVSEHELGAQDPRLEGSLQALGNWYESTAQRTAAREVWERLRALAADPRHPDPLGQIVALRGLAASYRQDYALGSETPAPDSPEATPMLDPSELDPMRRAALGMTPAFVLAPEGQEALERAVTLAEHLEPPAPATLAVVLVDLGDWHQVAGRADKALACYTRALPLLAPAEGAAEGGATALTRPSLLLYRAPPAAQRLRDQPAALVTEKYAVAEFTVTADGRVRDAKIVEGDATEAQRALFLSALGRATYRPRFVDGRPAATEAVRLRESFRQPKG
ncbi:MAG: tetratricopeptide repeat protein [Proteobacteria bacterium]|nr:tetratricopeptide repeat protein [Pseudomonadota bacterium]